MQRVDHYHIYHINDFLINCYLVLQAIVLDEGTVSSCVIVRLDFEVTTNAVLLNYFSSVNLFLDVELLPRNHVIKVLLL